MKKHILYLLGLLIVLTSCEDVVDIDTKDAPSKLVVEALINWEKGTEGNEQTILLRQSTSFFEQTVAHATGATVWISHEDGREFPFTETAPGEYTTTTFAPEIDATYTLIINYQNETYRAVEKMIAVNPIKRVSQRVQEFGGEETSQILFYFDDVPNVENFYFVSVFSDFQRKKIIDYYDDEFTDGNEIEDFYSSNYIPPGTDEVREYTSGDVIDLKLFGISKRFYNYVIILSQQADPGGGPFSIAPATAKGNCVNLTKPDNFPYGYFRLSEVTSATYTYE